MAVKSSNFGDVMCRHFDGEKVSFAKFKKKKIAKSIIDVSSYDIRSRDINITCPHCLKKMRTDKRKATKGMRVVCLGCKRDLTVDF